MLAQCSADRWRLSCQHLIATREPPPAREGRGHQWQEEHTALAFVTDPSPAAGSGLCSGAVREALSITALCLPAPLCGLDMQICILKCTGEKERNVKTRKSETNE